MQDYEQFVEKFKSKKTTDDCYTPDNVYNAVRDWAVKEYGLEGREIVRPFWPGGDYERYEYPDNCVVIDNPPFSIHSKIKEFYSDNGIDYFMFAPHLTLFSGLRDETCIIVSETVVYENGAKVETDFVTSLDSCKIRTAPKLKAELKYIRPIQSNTRKKYRYPQNVISSATLGKYSDVDFKLDSGSVAFTRRLDNQVEKKKAIFGGGFLISDNAVKEILKHAEKIEVEVWELSEREKDIIRNLK